jgi:hypothetical protein
MVFEANIDAKCDRTIYSKHTTEVSLISIHQKLIFGTLGIVALVIGVAIAVWIYHHKKITKHSRRHAAPPGRHVLPRRTPRAETLQSRRRRSSLPTIDGCRI